VSLPHEPMIVKCLTPARVTRPGTISRVTPGKLYEVITILGRKRTSYLLINDSGDTTTYGAGLFEVVSGEVKRVATPWGTYETVRVKPVRMFLPHLPEEPVPYCPKHFYTHACPVCDEVDL